MPHLRVWSTLQFEGFHRWPDAPSCVSYLRVTHRHVFHVRVEWVVSHGDREREFITAKRDALELVAQQADKEETQTWSCEHWAMFLLERLNATAVEVSEDGENGARVERS